MRVVLSEELPEQGLKTGDVDAVIHVYTKRETFEGEFVALDGETSAITTLDASQVRPVEKKRLHDGSLEDPTMSLSLKREEPPSRPKKPPMKPPKTRRKPPMKEPPDPGRRRGDDQPPIGDLPSKRGPKRVLTRATLLDERRRTR